MRKPVAGPSNALFAAFIALFICYGLVLVHQSSFVFSGQRYYVLFDDAMISMQYARNLAEGHGLVWNPGDPPTEGFSNPLWTLMMAGVHAFPIAESKLPLVVQIIGIALLAANLVQVRALSLRLTRGSQMAGWAAVLLTAFYLPLNMWGILGTEFSALAVLVTSAILLMENESVDRRITIRPYILLGIATLLRLDMVVPFLAILFVTAWRNADGRRHHIKLGGIVLASFIALQTVARLLYFDQTLPNTYYLKLTGYPLLSRLIHGLTTLGSFAFHINPLVLLLPIAWTLHKRRGGATLLLLSVVVSQCLYSVYVGGDAWEHWGGSNRFISVGMPSLFILWGVMLSDVCDQVLRRRWVASPAAARGVTIGLLALTLLQVNAYNGRSSLGNLVLRGKPFDTMGNAFATVHGLLSRSLTSEDARIAVVWAGSIPYYSHRYAVDLLGKNDPQIARQNRPHGTNGSALPAFYPGHMKWDYAKSIGQLKPDIIHQLWGLPSPGPYTSLHAIPEDAKPYVVGHYVLADLDGYRLLIRKDSSKVAWNMLQPYLHELEALDAATRPVP